MFTYNLIKLHLIRKNASITTADQLTSQPIRGIPVGSIPAKVVSVDCIHVKGLSIKRELLLPATT